MLIRLFEVTLCVQSIELRTEQLVKRDICCCKGTLQFRVFELQSIELYINLQIHVCVDICLYFIYIYVYENSNLRRFLCRERGSRAIDMPNTKCNEHENDKCETIARMKHKIYAKEQLKILRNASAKINLTNAQPCMQMKCSMQMLTNITTHRGNQR